MIRKTISVFLVAISLCLFARAQDQQEPKRSPSTPEERKRFVTVVHKLEKSPLDQTLNSDADWALRWLEDIPDVNVNICLAPLGHLQVEEYRYSSRIMGLFVLGMGAFQIEHPQKKSDEATFTGGLESALKAYRSILKNKPDAKSTTLDDLIKKQDDGELDDYVRSVSKECEADRNQT